MYNWIFIYRISLLNAKNYLNKTDKFFHWSCKDNALNMKKKDCVKYLGRPYLN